MIGIDWNEYFARRMNFLWCLRFDSTKVNSTAHRVLVLTSDGLRTAGELAATAAQATPPGQIFEDYNYRLFREILSVSKNQIDRSAILLSTGNFSPEELIDLRALNNTLSQAAADARQEASDSLYGE